MRISFRLWSLGFKIDVVRRVCRWVCFQEVATEMDGKCSGEFVDGYVSKRW